MTATIIEEIREINLSSEITCEATICDAQSGTLCTRPAAVRVRYTHPGGIWCRGIAFLCARCLDEFRDREATATCLVHGNVPVTLAGIL